MITVENEIKVHQENIKKLYALSPSTVAHQASIIQFLLTHPDIVGISNLSAEILMNERNSVIRKEAIHRISKKLKIRRDVNAPNFCITRCLISENQIRKTILDIKKENAPKVDIKSNQNPQKQTRSKVVSFRATGYEQDAIDYLASKCNVQKSFLVDVLIKISNRYGIALK